MNKLACESGVESIHNQVYRTKTILANHSCVPRVGRTLGDDSLRQPKHTLTLHILVALATIHQSESLPSTPLIGCLSIHLFCGCPLGLQPEVKCERKGTRRHLLTLKTVQKLGIASHKNKRHVGDIAKVAQWHWRASLH